MSTGRGNAQSSFLEDELTIKVVKWFLFGVMLAIAPIAADFMGERIQSPSYEFTKAISKGELALVCAGIAGGSIAEVVGSGRKWAVFKMIAAGSSVVMAFLSTAWYARVAAIVRSAVTYDQQTVADDSKKLLVCTIICSLGCILAAGAKE